MLTVIVKTKKPNVLNEIASLLKQSELKVIQEDTEAAILKTLQSQVVDAVIATEQDLPLVKKLVSAFPMVNYALMSSSDSHDFHELTEGYGIFMQLPTSLQESDVSAMINNLTRIKALSSGEKGEVR
jgi:hypothetical protein